MDKLKTGSSVEWNYEKRKFSNMQFGISAFALFLIFIWIGCNRSVSGEFIDSEGNKTEYFFEEYDGSKQSLEEGRYEKGYHGEEILPEPKLLEAIPTAKTDYAPIAPQQTIPENVKNYVSRFAHVAINEQKKYGIPASIKMAQGIIESRCGASVLAVGNNNHFGMKCFSKDCPKDHCTNHIDDHHKDFFRKYDTAWISWREHSKLLQGSRYNKLKKHKCYKKWAKGLQKAGYATDKNYAKKLIGVIEKYGLHQLDLTDEEFYKKWK